jgi:glyoxylase-like metal-dependent hydrolase (beta-lactamase superfamily II)
MEVISLNEGTFTVDNTKLFVPFDEQEHELQNRPRGSLLVEIQPFLVITSQDVLLLDTGLGFKKNNVLQLYQNLTDHHIDPASVTRVLLTHLHKDHAGGVSKEDPGNSRELTFPNAKYYLQERELNFALEKGFPSFVQQELDILKQSSQVVLMKDDAGIIDGHIYYQVTAAHSRYHQVFWIKEGSEIIFFGGDDAPQLQQMKHRIVAKYDFNGKKAMELRTQWWQQGQKEKWTFLFYHDVKNPTWSA